MTKPLLGEKIAVLVANGFCEKTLTEVQRAVAPLGASIRIISMDHGLVNSWNGEGWGLNFAADNTLSTALAADYTALIVPGGIKSMEKLKLTAHTKRFINGFLTTNKPVVMSGDALDLLIHIESAAGRNVAGPEGFKEAAETAGALWVDEACAVHDNLMTGDIAENIADATEFLISGYAFEKAA
jgi:protease I